MPEFPLSQSPRTQGFQVQPGPQDEDELFTQGFTDLAYKAFSKQNPELLADVLTLRVLDTDASSGHGVGAFVLKHNQEVFYVPVVVSDNAVKPLDMFYARRADRYYPLTQEWLQEASKGQVNQMGAGVTPPKTLQTDVDIRNLVVPPTTGRYSYAAENPSDAELWGMFQSAIEKTGDEKRPLYFPQFLARSPGHVKQGTAIFLQRNKRLLKKFAEVYGVKMLQDAFQYGKTAELRKEYPAKHDVFIASLGASPSYLKKELGPTEAGMAYQAIRQHGFYVKDRRPNTDDAFRFAQEQIALTEPKKSGIYRVFMANGDTETVLIVSRPIRFEERESDEEKMRGSPYGGHSGWSHNRINKNLAGRPGNYLVLFDDGRYAELDYLVAEPIIHASHAEVTEWVMKASKAKPANNEHGVLVCTASLDVRATEPFTAHNVTTKNDVTTLDNYGFSVAIHEKLRGNTALQPQNERRLVLSGNYRWISCKDRGRLDKHDILQSPRQIFMQAEWSLQKDGARPVTVKKAGSGFIVGNDGQVMNLAGAVKKAAESYNISVAAAMGAVKLAIEGRNPQIWVVKKGLRKHAQGETIGGDPQVQPLMDPSMQQGPPPGPSGIELAVAEQMQLVQQQMAGLQQQMAMLQTLQQRAQGIDQGGGAMAAPMGAASMQGGPGSLPGGQQAIAPMPQGDPSQGQGQAQPPPQDPNAGAQGGAPPQDPNAGAQGGAPPPSALGPGGMQANGAMPPQPMQDPNAQPPPPPVMDEDPTPDNIANQINPAFLDQAGALAQDDVFDAAAISSLAQNKVPKELIQTYMPTLDRALDNVGRVLLLYYLKETDIKEQIGNDQYTQTEQSLRDTFRGLGETLNRISQESDQLLPSMSQSA